MSASCKRHLVQVHFQKLQEISAKIVDNIMYFFYRKRLKTIMIDAISNQITEFSYMNLKLVCNTLTNEVQKSVIVFDLKSL